MLSFLKSLFKKPDLAPLQVCFHGQAPRPFTVEEVVPYAADHCLTCDKHMCHVCGEKHVRSRCTVRTSIDEHTGQGVLESLNIGQLLKLDIRQLRCICGKRLGISAAICAACGMASCSAECHAHWQAQGYCKFKELFMSIPKDFSMRSILFANIVNIQRSDVPEWVVANKSSDLMVSCYAKGREPHVYLQRGYRNYGTPNPELLSQVTAIPKNIDYHLFQNRRCSCSCPSCAGSLPHSRFNCQVSCLIFNNQIYDSYMLKPHYSKQCTCSCDMCISGILRPTHRLLDCMHCCPRSEYNRLVEAGQIS